MVDQLPTLAPIRTTARSKSCALKSDDTETGVAAPHEQGPRSCGHETSHLRPASLVGNVAQITLQHSRGDGGRPSESSETEAGISCNTTYGDPRAGFWSFQFMKGRFYSCTKKYQVAEANEEKNVTRPSLACMPRCLWPRRRQKWRCLALLMIPTGGLTYPATPSSNAQLFATQSFPRTPSGKGVDLRNYNSPRARSPFTAESQAPACTCAQVPSPKTPASSKVQHFSGSIPSPRTPYCVSSPGGIVCRRKPSISLVHPPGLSPTPSNRHSFRHQETIEEPSSPHVTCIGRVRRQPKCKKFDQARSSKPPRCRMKSNIAGRSKNSDAGSSLSRSSSAIGSLRQKTEADIEQQNRTHDSTRLRNEKPTTHACTQTLWRENHSASDIHSHELSESTDTEQQHMFSESDQIDISAIQIEPSLHDAEALWDMNKARLNPLYSEIDNAGENAEASVTAKS
ncbi:hypothetical protein KP509_04G091300 [Ceratopteris richardii]|uniref:Uncharacterized protein n=1 Tax=Ceratopteris richardii TaxID=49495 RepID=A0A8T2UZ62_CERRI|nr:hypothetical protein KP509_04G091300 [Ceratopteris richardii]